MNAFYKQPKINQWIEAFLLMAICFLPVFSIIEKGYSQPIYYLAFFIYLPFIQFSITPVFKLTGVYKYYSPMLLGYMPNNSHIDLHSGTSFDYLFVMRKYKPGAEFRNWILIYKLEGLLNIIKSIENGETPETVEVSGTSYYFNNRTLTKLGFEISNPSHFYKLNLLLNVIDLTWMYSISQGKIAFPKIYACHKATIAGAKLIENKKRIEELYCRLKAKKHFQKPLL